ncbi:DDE superfamily endonuclease domain [Phytophthora cactorum]|nr:DDE superfamily endonuclease domain [Phytophthora cactorum]
MKKRPKNKTKLKGAEASKSAPVVQEVADSFANSVNVAVEIDGILSFNKSFEPKYSGLFNMDQRAIFVDNPGKLTIDYRGTTNIDTIQGSSENTGRCSVFCAIWRPNVNGCQMLLLDSLKVHKMASIRQYLENDCATQVQYIPPGVTGLSQPVDVGVMKSFKKKIQYVFLNFHYCSSITNCKFYYDNRDLYVKHHIDHPFQPTLLRGVSCSPFSSRRHGSS